MWFILARSLLLGGGVLFWFGEFFFHRRCRTFKVALGAHVSFFLISERSFGNSNFCGRTAAVVLADYLYSERETSNVF